MRALILAKVQIPGGIQVVGFDGLEMRLHAAFPVHGPPGYRTVRQTIGDTVLSMIQGRQVPSRTILPVEFVKKESSR